MELKATVQYPCQQDWDKMPPVNGGRYCDSCKKRVLDISMSTEEILSTIAEENSKGSICIALPLKAAIIAGSLFLTSLPPANSQIFPPTEVLQCIQQKVHPDSIRIEPTVEESVVLKRKTSKFVTLGGGEMIISYKQAPKSEKAKIKRTRKTSNSLEICPKLVRKGEAITFKVSLRKKGYAVLCNESGKIIKIINLSGRLHRIELPSYLSNGNYIISIIENNNIKAVGKITVAEN